MITISYNYSSNDFEFLEKALTEALKVTDDIQISYVDKFFNGEDEDENLIEKTKKILKNKADFNKISYNPFVQEKFENQTMCFKYWHNITRFNNNIKAKYDYVLFLDGDEIIDGDEMKKWIESIDLNQYNSYIFNVYWYFRNKKYQATTWEEGPVLCKKNILFYEDFMSVHERWNLLKDPCCRNVKSLVDLPLIHHYSWAKGDSEEECKNKLLKKVSSWGHSNDKNWNLIIEEEFNRPFNGKDFIHGYSFKEI